MKEKLTLDDKTLLNIHQASMNIARCLQAAFTTKQEGKAMPKQISKWEDLDGIESEFMGCPIELRVNRADTNSIISVSVIGRITKIERDTVCVVDTDFPSSLKFADAVKYWHDKYGFDITLAPQFTAEQLKHIHAAKLMGFNYAALDDTEKCVYLFSSIPSKKGQRWWLIGEGMWTHIDNPIWQTIVKSTEEPFELFGEGE